MRNELISQFQWKYFIKQTISMDFRDLEINVNKPADKKAESANVQHEDLTQYSSDSIIYDVASYMDILDSVRNGTDVSDDLVVYGVYDNSKRNIFIRLNDFMIDSSKITVKDKSYFFHMLAVMVDAGIPVVHAIRTLASRTENPRFKRVLATIAYKCDAGMRVYDAMARFDDVFDEAEIGIVRAGEATGRLHTMLFRLSVELDKKNELSMKLWGAAAYPIAVLVVLVLVSVGMLIWVFPSLLGMLSEGGVAGDDLPGATRFLMSIQYGLTNYWWAILGGIFGIYLMFTSYVNTDRGHVKWNLLQLRIPIIGDFIRKVAVLRFISLLGLLIDAGLPVLTCLKITGGSISNTVYKIKIQELIDRVKSGWKISKGMEDSEFLFPSEVVQMVRVGEQSASLGNVARKVSVQYQKEIDNSLKKLSSVFEPAMILVVGLLVAVLALAVMAPIFNLSGTVS